MNLARPQQHRPGFTLLELCIVLFIMALMAGAAVPALRSAFAEQTLRNDAGRVARLVRMAVLASDEQQQPYLLIFDQKTLSLQPVTDAVSETSSEVDGVTQEKAAPVTVKLEHDFQSSDRGRWNNLSSASWRFEPNGLCPVPRLRVQIDGASLEISFNALTGDVDDDSLSVP